MEALGQLTGLSALGYRRAECLVVTISLFSFSLQGVGKEILIDKFWLVWLAFERFGNVYDFMRRLSISKLSYNYHLEEKEVQSLLV